MLKTSQKTFQRLFTRSFSSATTSASSDSETEANLRPKLDPLRKQVTDFLKNTSLYEEQVRDTLQPYYFRQGERLRGYANEVGTNNYYKMS